MQKTKEQIKKELNRIHKYTDEEQQIFAQAYTIKRDPRFVGTFEQAVDIAIELYVGVQPDPDAMRIRK